MQYILDTKLIANMMLLGIFVYAAVGNLLSWSMNKPTWLFFTKPLLIPVLAIYYVLNCRNVEFILVSALLFAFIGDIALIWPQKKNFFILGLLFFMVMHVLYIVFILKYQVSRPTFTFPVILSCLLFIIPGTFIYIKLFKFLNDLKVVTIIYVLALMAMSYLCFASMIGTFNKYSLIQFIGSLFFIISDALLAFDTMKKPMRYANLWVTATYINAQLFLFAGFMNTR